MLEAPLNAAQQQEEVLRLRIPPAWEHIKPVRELCVGYARTPMGAKVAESVGLVVSELLENAIKYGDVAARVELVVSIDWKLTEIRVRVSNQAQAARIRVLEREFGRSQEGSAADAFAQAVERLRSLPQGTAMLGLARIASAGELSLEVTGARVTMQAVIGRHGPRSASSGTRFRSPRDVAS